MPVDELYLRDTINVAYWDGKSTVYPSVKLRMDFRNPIHCWNLRLSLPSFGTRGWRHDGNHSRRGGPDHKWLPQD